MRRSLSWLAIFFCYPASLPPAFISTLFATVTARRSLRATNILAAPASKIRRMASLTVDDAFRGEPLLKRVDADFDNVAATLDSLKKDAPDLFVVAKAAWCPDCQAVPAIVLGMKEYATAKQTPVTVVICDVGSRDLWKGGAHPLKGEASVMKLAGVPMVLKWGADGMEKGRLAAGLVDGRAMGQGEAVVTKTVVDWLNLS